MSERRLWFTPDRSRFFLLPADASVGRSGDRPEGALTLRTLQGTSAVVTESDVVGFEVDAAAAKAHVDGGYAEVANKVRGVLRNLVGRASGGDADPGADAAATLDQWLPLTPGDLITDPDKVRAGRRSLLERAGRLVRRDVTDADVDRMEGQLDRIGATIAQSTDRLRAETDKLAHTLEERRPEFEATVETVGHQLADLGRGALDQLRALGGRPADAAGGERADGDVADADPDPDGDPGEDPDEDPDEIDAVEVDAVEVDPGDSTGRS